MRTAFAALILFSCTAIAGCGGDVPLEAPVVRPAFAPAPVAVDVLYAKALRDHECTGNEGYLAYAWTFRLGPPSMAMFDAVLPALFNEVNVLDARTDPGTSGRPVVEVRLAEFTGCRAEWPIRGKATLDLAYEAVARTPEGRELARWSGRGRAAAADADLYPAPATGVELAYLSVLTRVAMRRAAADFVVNFERDPSVRAWLRTGAVPK